MWEVRRFRVIIRVYLQKCSLIIMNPKNYEKKFHEMFRNNIQDSLREVRFVTQGLKVSRYTSIPVQFTIRCMCGNTWQLTSWKDVPNIHHFVLENAALSYLAVEGKEHLVGVIGPSLLQMRCRYHRHPSEILKSFAWLAPRSTMSPSLFSPNFSANS